MRESELQTKVDAFLAALADYVSAVITCKTTEQEPDSLGAYYEGKNLRYTLEDMLGMEPRRERE